VVEALLVLAGDPEAIDGWRGGQAGAGVDGDGGREGVEGRGADGGVGGGRLGRRRRGLIGVFDLAGPGDDVVVPWRRVRREVGEGVEEGRLAAAGLEVLLALAVSRRLVASGGMRRGRERGGTYPVAVLLVRQRMGDVEGGRDDVSAEGEFRVGGANLGQRLAARHCSAGAWPGVVVVAAVARAVVIMMLAAGCASLLLDSGGGERWRRRSGSGSGRMSGGRGGSWR